VELKNTVVLTVALWLMSNASFAQSLTQPNGTPIPGPMGCNGGRPTGLLPLFACTCATPGICNIGAPCTSVTQCDTGRNAVCESTIWHQYNDNACIPSLQSGLNPTTEAAIVPETFYPRGPLTFTMLSRGETIFKDGFGWYNVTGAAPAPADLNMMVSCNATPGSQVVLDILAEPRYKGGEIGFFIVTPQSHTVAGCANGDCCATVDRLVAGQGYAYYSERAYDADAAGSASWIHLLAYASHLAQNKRYFAWEDTYGGGTNRFTDMVVSVANVSGSPALQFTDDPLAPGLSTVKAVHVSELRLAVDTLRASHGLQAFTWTDLALVQGVAVVKAVHVTELRAALSAVYTAIGRTLPVWTPSTITAGATAISTVQTSELRAAIAAIW
jgi:hypothetical protein